MPTIRRCVVANCGNKSKKGWTLFKIPTNQELRQEWCKRAGLDINLLKSAPMLCQLHFDEEDLLVFGNTFRLRPGALPSISSTHLENSEESSELPPMSLSPSTSSPPNLSPVKGKRAKLKRSRPKLEPAVHVNTDDHDYELYVPKKTARAETKTMETRPSIFITTHANGNKNIIAKVSTAKQQPRKRKDIVDDANREDHGYKKLDETTLSVYKKPSGNKVEKSKKFCLLCKLARCICPKVGGSKSTIETFEEDLNLSIRPNATPDIDKSTCVNCRVCEKKFFDASFYEEHWRRYHRNVCVANMYHVPIQCQNCNLYFQNEQSLEIHMNGIHTGERLVGNLVKNMYFVCRSGSCDCFEIHLSQMKPLVLNLPGKYRVESKDLPAPVNESIRCRICKKRIFIPSYYEIHWKQHHGHVCFAEMYGTPIQCNKCNLYLSNERNLKIHLDGVHSNGCIDIQLMKAYSVCQSGSCPCSEIHSSLMRDLVQDISGNYCLKSKKLTLSDSTTSPTLCNPVISKQTVGCRICKKRIFKPLHYEKHWKRCHQNVCLAEMYEVPFQCLICKLYLLNKGCLRNHIKDCHFPHEQKNSDEGKNYFICQSDKCNCSKNLAAYKKLRYADKIEKKFGCQPKIVIKSNNPLTAFVCSLCHKMFTKNKYYKLHWNRKHGDVHESEMYRTLEADMINDQRQYNAVIKETRFCNLCNNVDCTCSPNQSAKDQPFQHHLVNSEEFDQPFQNNIVKSEIDEEFEPNLNQNTSVFSNDAVMNMQSFKIIQLVSNQCDAQSPSRPVEDDNKKLHAFDAEWLAQFEIKEEIASSFDQESSITKIVEDVEDSKMNESAKDNGSNFRCKHCSKVFKNFKSLDVHCNWRHKDL